QDVGEVGAARSSPGPGPTGAARAAPARRAGGTGRWRAGLAEHHPEEIAEARRVAGTAARGAELPADIATLTAPRARARPGAEPLREAGERPAGPERVAAAATL